MTRYPSLALFLLVILAQRGVSAQQRAPAPEPRAIARSMLSLGIDAARAASMPVRSRGFPSGSPPPDLAATVISRMSLVNSAPRFASAAAL